MLARLVLSYKTPYPTASERAEIENYLATVKARRTALDEVRRVAVRVIDNVIARMRVAYPQFAKFHAYGYEKTHRDLGLITSLTANAMFLGEYETLDEMFTEWFRTIMKSVHISPQCLKDVYTAWIEELQANLSEDSFALLRPFAEHMRDYLIQVPVPAKDETGERRPMPPANGVPTWKS